MAEEISKREFARRDGCSEKLVREGVVGGFLPVLASGKLDAALVGTGWRKANRRGGEGADPSADLGADPGADPVRTLRTPQPPSAPAEDVAVELEHQPHGDARRRSRRPDESAPADDDDPEEWSLAIAERRKAVALAKTRELDLHERQLLVVPSDVVIEMVGAEYARVRTRLLAIPSEQAPRLHRLKTVAEVEDALRGMVVQALEELTRDGAGRPS